MLALLPFALAVELVDTDPPGDLDRLQVELGGYLQPRFTFTQADSGANTPGELGFGIERVRLEHGGRFTDGDLSVGWQLSLEMMPEARLQDAWLELSAARVLALRVGQFKAPTSRDQLCSDRHTLMLAGTELSGLVPGRELGAMLSGDLLEDRLLLQAAAFNGEGRNRLGNVNHKLLYAWRVVASPMGGARETSELRPVDEPTGFAFGYSGHLNVLGAPGAEEASITHVAEGFAHWRYATVQGEVLWSFTDFQNVDVPDSNALAWYAQAGVFVPGSAWTTEHLALSARFEQVDPFIPIFEEVPLAGPTDPAQARRALSVGAGLYGGERFEHFDDLRLLVSWTFARELEGSSYDNDTLQVLGQLSF